MAGVWSACPICGAVIADRELHDAWHALAVEEPVTPGEEPTHG